MCPDQGSNRNLLVYGMTVQPTELPGQGSCLNSPKISYPSLIWLFICFLAASLRWNDSSLGGWVLPVFFTLVLQY